MDNFNQRAGGDDGQQPTNGPYLVLFVDDEQNILDSLRRVFRKEPYQLLTTTDIQEALSIMRNRPVALLISDYRMPEMMGTQFLSLAHEIRPETIQIMLTGYSNTEVTRVVLDHCQIYRYIEKPWNDDELLSAVREGIRRYELKKSSRN